MSIFGSAKLITLKMAQKLRTAHFKRTEILGYCHVFSSLNNLQDNSRIEDVHIFLKTSKGKHISQDIEWDELLPLAASAYNESSSCV